METVNKVEVNRKSDVQLKTLKRQRGLGKLNRLTKTGKSAVMANGHTPSRFKRDYDNGTANYKCANCGATAMAQLGSGRGETSLTGAALSLNCGTTNS